MLFHFHQVVLSAYKSGLPPEVLSSDQIEDQLAPLYEKLTLPKGRLFWLTGIDKRHISLPKEKPSQRAISVALELMEEHGVDPSSIDLLIYAGVSRDFLEPATASVVHAGLNLSPHALFFDLSNACLGVLQGWYLASSLIERGVIKRALVVSSEVSRPLTEATMKYLLQNKDLLTRKAIRPMLASLTIGSGAVASLLECEDFSPLSSSPNALRLERGAFLADTHSHTLCQGGESLSQGVLMETDSEELMQKGLLLAHTLMQECKTHWGEAIFSSFDKVITHQVGGRHHEALLERLSLSHLPSPVTYPFLGNTGSAALPLTLFHDNIKKGENLLLLGIGSGLSSLFFTAKKY